MIEIKNLTKLYSASKEIVKACDDVSLSIKEGEYIALVGESGAGKSIFFHLIAGLDKPDKGAIYIKGKNIFDLKKDEMTIFRRNEIGLIYQFYNLIPILTVEENITFPAKLNR